MKFALCFLLVIAGFLDTPVGMGISAAMDAANGFAYDDCTSLSYRVSDKQNGRTIGYVTIQIQQGTVYHRWIEHRHYGDDDIEKFDVTFDPESLMPIDYLRTIRNKDGETTIFIDRHENRLSVHTEKPNGRVSTQHLDLPEEPYVIEPFFKFFISRAAAETGNKNEITLLALYRGKLKPFKMEWKALGEETVTVPMGTLDCLTIKISSKNSLLKLINKGTVIWLDSKSNHSIVRTPVRRKLFGDEYMMELVENKKIPCFQQDLLSTNDCF